MAAAVSFDCSSPTVPEVPLSTDLNLSATPGDMAPVLLSARPWRWRANWAVNLTAPEEVARGGDVLVSLRTRIEQEDGHVLAELNEEARRLEPQAGMRSVVQFPETVTYETQADPPTKSRLVMTARLFDAHGRSEEVSATRQVVEALCGGKYKPTCDGALIAVSAAGGRSGHGDDPLRATRHVLQPRRGSAQDQLRSTPRPHGLPVAQCRGVRWRHQRSDVSIS
jgi:hypothetical protein